ncbi:AraC family transcriptional regulator [Rhodobacter sp. 140A]|uniref:Transcriptional activator NphR n=1 Tax=bioreactor metagenome TaxID=1076179 RepID=A0A644WL45_9ZZZZ|nr:MULTISPECIES: AraC family transcriptional regulator [Thioclava]RBP84954.1 AraC family transcriptional regulator [Rhodobacter sp. 140A]
MARLAQEDPRGPFHGFGMEMVDYAAGESTDPPSDSYMVCLVTRGVGEMRVRLDGGRAHRVIARPGTFVPILSPGVVGEYWSEAPMRHLVLSIPAQGMMRRGGVDDLRRLSEDAFSNPLLVELVHELWSEGRGTLAQDRLYAETLLSTFCDVLGRAAVSKPGGRASGACLNPIQVARLRDYCEAHLHEKMTLEDLAQIVGMSERNFARAFKAAVDETPYQFLMALRIERAKNWLETGDLPLTDIAAMTGFADQAHFTAAFARRVGQSPARYRAAWGKD